MEVSIEAKTLRFRRPLETSYATLTERPLLEVRLQAGEDLVGIGEAAPLPPYDGISIEDARAALETCRPLLVDGDSSEREELLDACWLEAGLAQAVAAIDLALWDLEGKRAGRPAAALLAERPAAHIEVHATIGATDRAAASAAAAEAVTSGFRCLKVKVGVGDDPGRLAAVRAAAGPEAALRVDANGAWDVEEALANLSALAPAGIDLAEEPVHGVQSLRAVRERSPVQIAMDETAGEPGAIESGAADAVCLKLSRSGGISGLLAAARAARAAGSDVYLSSTFDGPIGIAGALHAAAALAPLPPCGLATLGLFEGSENPFPVVEGAIAVPSGAGLGVH